MIRVRRGAASDTDWMVEQLQAFSEFFGSKISVFDEDFTRQNLPAVMENNLVLVAENVEEQSRTRMGFIAGQISPHAFNPKIKVLVELFWWVEPRHRMTSAGARLLKEYIEVGKDMGVHWITMALEEQSPVREESLLKKGFRRTERAYLMEVA